MGLIDKFKNLFTEEVEEPEKPIKKEVIQVPIPAPEKKEVTAPVVETENKEEKFVFPVYFDDKDFNELDHAKPKVEEKKKVEKVQKEPYKKTEPEKRLFQPSPIISPVYGVLDRNYYKEDITTKKRPEAVTPINKELSIDDVRKKLYGTLEDDLENTMFGTTSILFNQETEQPSYKEEDDFPNDADDFFSDLTEEDITKESNYEEATEDEFSFTKMDLELSALSPAKHGKEEEDNLEELYEHQSEEEMTDSDLLNLIDSMYEKKEDE